MTELPVLDEESLQQIYTWIDDIPLSRPKKNITRDFSDGVLIAEIIHHFIPKMVDMHNYTAASSTTTKLDNWNLLSRKCFNKLQYNIDENLVKGAVACKAGVIELVLQDLRHHVEAFIACKKAASLVEKQKYHDELAPNSYNYEAGDPYQSPQAGVYNGSVNGYGHPYSEGIQSQPPTGGPTPQYQPPTGGPTPQYQYQYSSQPLPAASLPAPIPPDSSGDGSKANVEAAHKASRKPVTQASKMKTKTASSQILPSGSNETTVLRLALEEKEQALLASQETVQILQAKIRRLEHLLHLKDLRINEMKNQQQTTTSLANIQLSQQTINQPRGHLPPNQNFPIHQPPHGYNNTQFPPHPPLPQIPRPLDDPRKFQQR